MASTTPAALIGAHRKGRLAPGFDADLVALSPNLEVETVWTGGVPIEVLPRAMTEPVR
jgi:N-acetylglucosamine-6-phosphate deacetylase